MIEKLALNFESTTSLTEGLRSCRDFLKPFLFLERGKYPYFTWTSDERLFKYLNVFTRRIYVLLVCSHTVFPCPIRPNLPPENNPL